MFSVKSVFLSLSLLLLFVVYAYAGSRYESEILAEFSPAGDNYLSGWNIGFANPFRKKWTWLIEQHKSWIFNVDNEGRLYYWGYAGSHITILDISTGDTTDLKPSVNENKYLNDFLLGPEDEIYVDLSNYSRRNRKFYRYNNIDGAFILDDDFNMPDSFTIPRAKNIGPNGKLFFGNHFIDYNGVQTYDVFDQNGNFIKNSYSPCITYDGTEFYLRRSNALARENHAGIIVGKGDSLFLGTPNILSVKCTINNKIIVIIGDRTTIALGHMRKILIDKPCAFIVDLNKGRYITIDPYYECADQYQYYPFHTVSNVECNFKGDIYASVIYFIDPSEISEDDKTVIYRWKNVED